jgi:outer membrane protein TolC
VSREHRSTIKRASALLLVTLSLLAAGAGRAEEPFSLPIGSNARKGEPLPAGDKIDLSLQRAIVLSLENTLDLDVSSLTYEKSAFGIGAAKGAFDPFVQLDGAISDTKTPVSSSIQTSESKIQQLNASFGGLLPIGTNYLVALTNTRSDGVSRFTQINPTLGSNLQLSATQPLLRNFGWDVNTRFVVQARYSRDISAWDFSNTVRNTIQKVDSAYWDLVYALSNLNAKREALDRAKDLNRITKIKIDVGALAPIDVVQTEVTIAQREQDIILAEGAIGDAQDALKRLLNVQKLADWDRPIVPSDHPDQTLYKAEAEEGIRRAFETRPEVKQAVLDIESKKLTLVYNRNQLKPRLDLSASYGLGGLGAQKGLYQECTATGFPADATCILAGGTIVSRTFNYSDAYQDIAHFNFPSWRVGLVLNVPVFNITARNNTAIASTDLELSRTNLALLRQNLVVEVRSAARGIDTAYRSILAARKGRELAERNLDAEQKKYENGMTTSFQVAQIQNDLTTARTFELQAIAAYRKSITAWHKSTGDLLKEKNIIIAGLPVTQDPTPGEEGGVR